MLKLAIFKTHSEIFGFLRKIRPPSIGGWGGAGTASSEMACATVTLTLTRVPLTQPTRVSLARHTAYLNVVDL